MRTVVVPVGFCVLPLLAFWFWIQIYVPWCREQDLIGAIPHTGVAEVIGAENIFTGFKDSIPALLLKLKGQTVQARSYIPVRLGQQVKAAYRIGKSGAYYVDHIEPL